ncbi:hypothetical protein [Desulfosporosinus orientis]|uniref:hypothetical protein n=1 Tax=Desulfosporosinus orientis TaxID=1563 RepID=UPI00130528A5|nr:hypothetical protein [Desulfosporosinus orientis]
MNNQNIWHSIIHHRCTVPGHALHRRFIVNIERRIDELIKNHSNRIANVLSILKSGTMSAYQVAQKMDWNLNASWEEFPHLQQVCATGEAISHLEYLVHQHEVQVTEQKGCLLFSLTM